MPLFSSRACSALDVEPLIAQRGKHSCAQVVVFLCRRRRVVYRIQKRSGEIEVRQAVSASLEMARHALAVGIGKLAIDVGPEASDDLFALGTTGLGGHELFSTGAGAFTDCGRPNPASSAYTINDS